MIRAHSSLPFAAAATVHLTNPAKPTAPPLHLLGLDTTSHAPIRSTQQCLRAYMKQPGGAFTAAGLLNCQACADKAMHTCQLLLAWQLRVFVHARPLQRPCRHNNPVAHAHAPCRAPARTQRGRRHPAPATSEAGHKRVDTQDVWSESDQVG